MAVVNGLDRLLSFVAQKKFGLPQAYGRAWYGYSQYGDDNERSGVYQVRKHKKGHVYVKLPHMWPKNPQTEAQQAWRDVFRQGVAAWHALTTDEQAVYNSRAYPKRMEGFNLFLKEWLYEHRPLDQTFLGVYGVGNYGRYFFGYDGM